MDKQIRERSIDRRTDSNNGFTTVITDPRCVCKMLACCNILVAMPMEVEDRAVPAANPSRPPGRKEITSVEHGTKGRTYRGQWPS